VDLLTAGLLGVVQGLTEFLPVSSSAHLILAREFLGWNAEAFGRARALAFDVACHVGTLGAVVAFFRREVTALLGAVPRAFSSAPGPAGRQLWLIAAGTAPVVVAGLVWTDAVEAATRTPTVAAVALLSGAVLLLAIERVGTHGKAEDTLTVPGALAIGVAQSIALVPGVSRSGATIATGMALGLRRDAAARFAFLMSMPAILAAAAKEALELRTIGLAASDAPVFIVGVMTSALVGYATVKYFLRFLVMHRLDVFAWYRIGLAAATFVWLAGR
jgi:undecaprenyl-diphosphatase